MNPFRAPFGMTANPDQPDPLVLREDTGPVATLTLNRPKQLNALSQDMLSALLKALDSVASDKSIRVAILQGSGRAFCAGHDLKEMRANPDLAFQQRLFAQCSEVMLALRDMPQPVIAQVHGIATAAGCQLVAACDLAIAADDTRFATSGINVGLFCTTPGVALGRAVARKHAMEMLLTGDFIDAARAQEIGLINRAVSPASLSDETMSIAGRITNKSAPAIALGKHAFYGQMELNLDEAYAFAGEEMARNMMDRDAAEGIDAFIEKRKPVWQGD